MNKILRALLFGCYTAIIAVLLLELLVRFVIRQPYYAFPEGYFINNEYYGYGLAPNFKGKYSQPEFTISIDTNSQGLRDKELSHCENCFRILGLGDSFAFGDGVELGQSYLSILERLLDKGGGERYEVIKAGVIGYSTFNEKLYLEKKGLGYLPDLVIVEFWWDDLGIGQVTYLADTGFLTTGKINNAAHWRLYLNRHWRSYAFLRAAYTRIFKKALFASQAGTLLESRDALKKKFEITLNEFNEINYICSQNNIKCVFVLIPLREFVYDKAGSRKQWDGFRAFLDSKGIKYIDVTPDLIKAVRSGAPVFFSADPHLNKTGHRVVAEAIYRYLFKMQYLHANNPSDN